MIDWENLNDPEYLAWRYGHHFGFCFGAMIGGGVGFLLGCLMPLFRS